MNKIIAYALAVSLGWAGAAFAENCPSSGLTTITNGDPADATPVRNNFNYLQYCINANVAPITNPFFNGQIWQHGPWLSIGQDTAAGTADMGLFFGNGSGYRQLYFGTDGWFHTTGPINLNGNYMRATGYQWQDLAGTTPEWVVQGDGNLVFYNTDASGALYPSFYQFTRTNSSTIVFLAPTAFASDLRLKKNVQSFSGGLAVIQKLRPVRFDWNTPAERAVGKSLSTLQGSGQIGFIAQEVQQVVPEAVVAPRDNNDIYSYKPDVLIPILVKALQEEQAEIDALKAQVAAIKGTTQ